jgi:hypothetical protein
VNAVDTEKVIVRRRWDARECAEVSATSLWGVHLRNEPGGVCGALPRALLYAHVWCDKLAKGSLGHRCREESSPHELLVCILPNDNPVALYEHLRTQARA